MPPEQLDKFPRRQRQASVAAVDDADGADPIFFGQLNNGERSGLSCFDHRRFGNDRKAETDLDARA